MREAIKDKRRSKLLLDVLFLYDNARAHRSEVALNATTQLWLQLMKFLREKKMFFLGEGSRKLKKRYSKCIELEDFVNK